MNGLEEGRRRKASSLKGEEAEKKGGGFLALLGKGGGVAQEDRGEDGACEHPRSPGKNGGIELSSQRRAFGGGSKTVVISAASLKRRTMGHFNGGNGSS